MRRLFLLVLLVGCVPEPLPEPADYDPHPEPPTIDRDVAMVDDAAEFTRPYVPGHRTTMDGRVGVRVQGGPPGTVELAENLSFYLFSPEGLDEPILPGPPGARILADVFDVPFPPALNPSVERLGHHAVCDPTLEFGAPGERPNPSACGPDDAHDCYDFVVVSSTSRDLTTTMWGTPVTVQVEAPKTAAARIFDVVLGDSVRGTDIRATTEFTEPAVTMDGRLLTGRLGRFPRRWTNPETGEELRRPYDLAYAQLPDDAEPCDITGWTDFHPMSHAPYDPRMVGTYGLAAYPFRDTEGELIPDGEDLGGTYPWVDREGANVFMTGVHGTIAEQSELRYPRRCVVEGCEDLTENVDWDRGFLVGGLWTHGKFVHLDGMINNVEWAVGVTPAAHWMVDMYRDDGGEDHAVRFGGGRFINTFRNAGGPYPDGYTHNANIMDSLQNLLNHRPAVRPVTPRDVVWLMSSGVATDEIVFDDLLDPDAFVVANMQASITQLYDDALGSLSVPYHRNGQIRTLEGLLIAAAYTLHPDDDEEIHLQNAATSLRWNVPRYGFIEAGAARIEPVALGGVKGRGLWLSGYSEVRYAIPAQPRDVGGTPWYVGVHLDARSHEDEVHFLFDFPDGSGVRLAGRETVQYTRGEEVLHEVELPPNDGWVHLGWRIVEGGEGVSLIWNGVPYDDYTGESVMQMTEGDFVVGRAGLDAWGFRGWIDDLVVLAHDVDLEVACNHAGGTLIDVGDSGVATDHTPQWAHGAIEAAARGATGTRYACWSDRSADWGAHLGNIPAGATSVREAILFPEGPLRHGEPRPDSSRNPFCLSCHHADGLGGLGLEALEPRDVLAEDDPRRQPLQPPRRVFGNIPAGWIAPGAGPGSPDEASVAPPEGALIDRWVLPAAP